MIVNKMRTFSVKNFTSYNKSTEARLQAMRDIHQFKLDNLEIIVVGLVKKKRGGDHYYVVETYQGMIKKDAIKRFEEDHPECFKTYIDAYTPEEYWNAMPYIFNNEKIS